MLVMLTESDAADSCRQLIDHQHFACEREWGLRQAAVIHQRNSSSPVAMAVEKSTYSAAIHDAWKGLVGFWQLYMTFKATSNAKSSEL